MRRRCLVFEMAGARRKHMEDGSASDSPVLLKSDDNTSSNQQIVQSRTENDSSRVLPGIGLHLNALAATPKDFKILNHESSASGRLLIGPSSSANFLPPTSGQDLLSNTLANYSLEREIDNFESGGLPLEDPSQESGYIANEDINPSSPKKRRYVSSILLSIVSLRVLLILFDGIGLSGEGWIKLGMVNLASDVIAKNQNV